MIAPEVQFMVYFIYGLTFFSMGLTLLLESWRMDPAAPQIGMLRPLATFGLIHGIHEWMEIFMVQLQRNGEHLAGYLIWVHLGLLAVSFVALWFYSIAAFHFGRAHIIPITMFGLITLPLFALLAAADVIHAYSIGSIPFYRLVGSLVRYGLGVPGAAIASLGLYTAALKARADNRHPLIPYLLATAAGFALYSLTQVFVPSMNSWLAARVNSDVFQSQFGFPIQVVRTITAMIITFGIFNTVRFLETERQLVVAAANQARLEVLQQKEALRRDLLRHTVRTQEDERARIARELHDEMAQILTAFSLDLGTLQRTISKRSKAHPVLSRLQDLGKQMSHGMQTLVHDLRPALLDDLGLVPALRYLAENDALPHGLRPTFELHGSPRRIDPLIEIVLYRIAQEAVTNIIRHSQTHNSSITLTFHSEKIELKISDNGIGFNPAEKFIPPRGWGLAGMQERAESTGGQLTITSEPGKGTTIHAIIPITLNSEEISTCPPSA